MRKKRVLLQCQSLTYLYNGLAAIYTKHTNNDVIIDVLLTVNPSSLDLFKDKIYSCKYIRNVFILCTKDSELLNINKEINRIEKNDNGKLLFNIIYKNKIKHFFKKQFNGNNYQEIYYSHELGFNLMSYMRIAYTKAHFVMYGDGSGLLMGRNTKLINLYAAPYEHYFFDEVKPDEIIGLAPFTEDNSIDISDVNISATDGAVLRTLIKNDYKIQNEINLFTDELLKKYAYCSDIAILLTSRLEDKRFLMNEDDQINIYVDMINKYVPENCLLVLKLHPTSSVDLVSAIKERCDKKIEIVPIPQELKMYPIELFTKILKGANTVISFLSSSKISLKILYGIDCIDASDIVQNYNLKDRVNFMFEVFSKILEKYECWNKKSLIYECDVAPVLTEFYEKNNLQEENPENTKKQPQEITLKNYFSERLFSYKEIKYEGKTRKRIVILGIKITL